MHSLFRVEGWEMLPLKMPAGAMKNSTIESTQIGCHQVGKKVLCLCLRFVIMNRERRFINLAGQNQFQAHNYEHFDFPVGSCDIGEGLG